MNETPLTIIGNLAADPELRFQSSGTAVASFTVMSTPRNFEKQTGEWKDGTPLAMRCSVWREQAEHVAETLTRGARVIVQGRLKQRSFETREGEKRTVVELEVDEVGPSLKYATAKVNKVSRGGGSGGFGGDNQDPSPSGRGHGSSGSQGGTSDPWATPAPVGGGRPAADDEPPF